MNHSLRWALALNSLHLGYFIACAYFPVLPNPGLLIATYIIPGVLWFRFCGKGCEGVTAILTYGATFLLGFLQWWGLVLLARFVSRKLDREPNP